MSYYNRDKLTYIPLIVKNLSGAWFLWVSRLPIVSVLRNANLRSVHLKTVMYEVSLPTSVKLVSFCFVVRDAACSEGLRVGV